MTEPAIHPDYRAKMEPRKAPLSPDLRALLHEVRLLREQLTAVQRLLRQGRTITGQFKGEDR
jgi:hypothetical protein